MLRSIRFATTSTATVTVTAVTRVVTIPNTSSLLRLSRASSSAQKGEEPGIYLAVKTDCPIKGRPTEQQTSVLSWIGIAGGVVGVPSAFIWTLANHPGFIGYPIGATITLTSLAAMVALPVSATFEMHNIIRADAVKFPHETACQKIVRGMKYPFDGRVWGSEDPNHMGIMLKLLMTFVSGTVFAFSVSGWYDMYAEYLEEYRKKIDKEHLSNCTDCEDTCYRTRRCSNHPWKKAQ